MEKVVAEEKNEWSRGSTSGIIKPVHQTAQNKQVIRDSSVLQIKHVSIKMDVFR
jgi:hypothetical protein